MDHLHHVHVWLLSQICEGSDEAGEDGAFDQ